MGPEPGTRLVAAVLGQEPHLTSDEVAERTGVSVEDAKRLWRALGFPEVGGEPAFTDADADAVGEVARIVRSGAVDLDMALDLTRALGQTMARLADWESATLLSRIEQIEAGEAASGSRTTTAVDLVGQVAEPFDRLVVYAWRRHLAAAIARLEALGAADADLHTTDLTVGFADIVAFTALSNRLEKNRIGDLVELFETRCHDVVSTEGGRVIKSLGDSVLFVVPDPVAGVRIAEGIINVIGRDPRMPDVRVGLATGAVVMRLGDVFGPPVNMAARLTAVARRNRLIVDQATADLLPGEEFEWRRLPARPVRGFGLVEPVTVRRR